MLNVKNIGNRTSLAENLTETGMQIRVETGTGAHIDMGVGNHVYLTFRTGNYVERVKATARLGDIITLGQRGVDGTHPRAWPRGTCVSIEWNPQQLCEFIQACMEGAPTPTGVEAQTICMSSCKCIDVGADGRITRIHGGTEC